MKDEKESNTDGPRDLHHALEHFEKCKISFLLGFSILKRMKDREDTKRRIADESMEDLNKKME